MPWTPLRTCQRYKLKLSHKKKSHEGETFTALEFFHRGRRQKNMFELDPQRKKGERFEQIINPNENSCLKQENKLNYTTLNYTTSQIQRRKV